MGRDLYEASAAARHVFDTADRVLGYSLTSICFEGPDEKLRQTEYTQPAIFTTSLACLAAAIESGQVASRPAFMAGHSLGEYSALVAAGALTLEDGLSLLSRRAQLMAEAGRQTQGTLAAVIGLEEDAVYDICKAADVDVCNLNLPAQTVIGGTPASIEKAMELAKERGASRVQPLNVSGAFHSRLMRPAVEGLTKRHRLGACSQARRAGGRQRQRTGDREPGRHPPRTGGADRKCRSLARVGYTDGRRRRADFHGIWPRPCPHRPRQTNRGRCDPREHRVPEGRFG